MNTVISLITCIIEYYICHTFLSAFLQKRRIFSNPLTNLLVFSAITLFHCGVILHGISSLNVLSFVLMNFLYSVIVFEGKVKGKIIYLISICSISWGCEFLLAIILEIPSFLLEERSVVNLSDIPWHLFTLSLLKYIVCNIVIQISKKSKSHIDNKIFKYYLCIPIASICIMFLTYYSGIDFIIDDRSKVMLCVYFALMQLGNILVFYAFKKHSDELYNNVHQQLIISDQNLKLNYFNQMQDLSNSHKEFIHDTKHYIRTIGSLMSQEKYDEAMNIMSDLNIELERTVTQRYSSNDTINSILTEKKKLAERKNINMDIYVEPGTILWNASDVDIITLLCNLIDNAIEASEKCTDKRHIMVRIFMENNGEQSVIKIANSFSEPPIAQGDGFKSSKHDNGIHGVGIKSIQRTAKKCGGYASFFTENNTFNAVVLLPKINN